jgi:hypothetical protein
MVRVIPALSSEAASSPTPRPELRKKVSISKAILFFNIK